MQPLVPRRDWMPHLLLEQPQLAAYRDASALFIHFDRWPSVAELDAIVSARALTVASGAAVHVVDQPSRRGGVPPIDQLYDGRIYLRGEIPTRVGTWHDLFNVLCWIAFPQAKRAVNVRQYQALVPWYESARGPDGRCERLPGARTREQDALAMLDEGGLLLLTDNGVSDELSHALESADHSHVATLVRAQKTRPLLFGHAMYEHIVSSDAPVRALPVLLRCESIPSTLCEQVKLADRALAARLENPTSFAAPSRWKGLTLDRALFTPPLAVTAR